MRGKTRETEHQQAVQDGAFAGGSKKRSSHLVSLLASQFTKPRKGEILKEQESIQTASKLASVLPLPTDAKRPRLSQPVAQGARQCPLCGDTIPSHLYDSHMESEMQALDAAGEDEWADCKGAESSRPPAQPYFETRQPLNPAIPKPKAREKEQKVYVLGGCPSVAVPKNPRKLKQLPIARQPWAPKASAFNYYADGGGLMDGDELGLDGHAVAGMAWEGVGATTY